MDPADEFRTSRYVGVGCVTAMAGLFSGGMVGVLVAKMVMLIGILTLPVLALARLRRGDREAAQKDQEN